MQLPACLCMVPPQPKQAQRGQGGDRDQTRGIGCSGQWESPELGSQGLVIRLEGHKGELRVGMAGVYRAGVRELGRKARTGVTGAVSQVEGILLSISPLQCYE